MTQTKGGSRWWTLAVQLRRQICSRCSDDCAATRWRAVSASCPRRRRARRWSTALAVSASKRPTKNARASSLRFCIARASFSALLQKCAHSMRARSPRQSLTRSRTRLYPPQEEGSEAMESLEKTLRVRKQEADAVKVLLKRDRCAQPPVMRMLVLKISRPRTKPSPPPPCPAARPPRGWTRRWPRTAGPMNWRRRRTWQVMCRACTCAAVYGAHVSARMLAQMGAHIGADSWRRGAGRLVCGGTVRAHVRVTLSHENRSRHEVALARVPMFFACIRPYTPALASCPCMQGYKS